MLNSGVSGFGAWNKQICRRSALHREATEALLELQVVQGAAQHTQIWLIRV
jgi:hypothetical protein